MAFTAMTELKHSDWLSLLLLLVPLTLLTNAAYNLFFHPLAHIPGPFWGRASGITSWYYAKRGDRHVWLREQFRIYGDRIRPDPNTVLFRGSEAYADIYGTKANVRRSDFYQAFRRNDEESTTLTSVDVSEHARRRKRLALCFTEKSVRAASDFIIRHVDRWTELIAEDIGDTAEWSSTVNFSERIDALVFDIMADLCFGKSFDIKEPGENPLKQTPHNIIEYMKFYYLMCRAPRPVLKLLLWLKPRGLDWVVDLITPPAAQEYNRFVTDLVTKRIALQKKQAAMSESDRRQDMFYFLAEARDALGRIAYDESELHAESSLLIIAGSDTTSISLSGIFFYLTGDLERCQKLTDEIRSVFTTAEEVVLGPKLQSCTYLKACIDEGMRLTPSGPCDPPREVLPRGIRIKGEYYPPGTIVGIVPWDSSRDSEVYGDAEAFRPERWIPGGGESEEALARAKAGFHPFLTGTYNCVGKNLAMAEMLIVVARTLHRFDVRRTPGSTMGAETKDASQFQLADAFIAIRNGPEVQFRKRAKL
ncbi:cytochrome P450 monooxygenase-like protein [Xylariaceae sp. FL0804]|nr:cytochrome P450 monooxygenase-like protein [Xylariaceae sp. FL0804]